MLARVLCIVGCLASAAVVQAQTPTDTQRTPAEQTRTFLACPIYRDTDAGRKSGCWLADDAIDGVRYDISLGPVKPQVGHVVLVEGVPSDEPEDLCGGKVLTPVRIAVLPDRCPRYQIDAGNYPGRPYKSPPGLLRPASEPRTLPPPPYEPQQFVIYFEFDRDFLIYQYSEVILEKISLYAKASHAHQVDIEGFAATDPIFVQGRWLREPAQLAQSRANMVAEALRRLGVAPQTLKVAWHTAPAPTDLEQGRLPQPSKRRVVITVTP